MNPSKTSRIIFAFVALALYAMSPAKAESGRGALCLTFDDRNFDAWERCIPLFGKYGAHATFFVCGEIDERAERCMKRLAAGGHSLGLHGLRHRKATEGVAALGEEGYLRDWQPNGSYDIHMRPFDKCNHESGLFGPVMVHCSRDISSHIRSNRLGAMEVGYAELG